MPGWMWGPIAVGGAALLSVVLWILIKTGSRIESVRIGKTAFVIHGEGGEGETPLGRALRYVPEHIGELTALLAGRYYRLAKMAGVPPALITEVADSKLAAALLDAAIAKGNGSNSAQKIVESEILSRNWEGRDLEAYVRQVVVPRVLGSVRTVINDRYDSIVWIDAHTRHERAVSQVEWYDDLVSAETGDEVTRVLVPFFAFAADCLLRGGAS